MRYLLLCLLFSSALCSGQEPFTKDYFVNETANPVKVNALVQDKVGYIWIGTDEGLYKYNGQAFLKVADAFHRPITALYTSGNNLWVGCSDGSIGILDRGRIKTVKVYRGLSNAITSLYASNYIMLAGTEGQGLFLVINNLAQIIDTTTGISDNYIYTAALLSYSHILTGTDKGLNEIKLEQNKTLVHTITQAQGLPDNIVRVIKHIPHTTQTWIGTQDGGICIYNTHTHHIDSVCTGNAWKWGQVNDILSLTQEHAWVATEEGYLVDVYHNAQANKLIPYHHPGKVFRKLMVDRAGNIWCATNTGLTMMTSEYLYHIPLRAPYYLPDVTAMGWENNKLLVALKSTLYTIPLNDTIPTLQKTFALGATITSMYKDADNTYWIGTWGKGLYYKTSNSTTLHQVTGISYLNNESILSITGIGKRVWVAGLNGVEELGITSDKIALIKHHDKKEGIGSDYVYQLYPDTKGNIWMATDGAGVCMYNGQQYLHWDSFFSKNNKVAYSITEDAQGNMWAGTLYKDLYRYQGERWQNLRRQETQYVDINISTVSANATGQVLSVYQRCIDEWYPKSGYYRHYNSAMGIGLDSTSNVLNCTTKDSVGNVYLPYQHGILIMKNQYVHYNIRPDVHITAISIYLKPVNDGRNKFAYDENHVTFSFEGINYINTERLNYRYKLEGFNNAWVVTRDASVTFPQLPSGQYKFRVQISLNPGFNNASEDVFDFVITPPFFKTWWFYLICLIVIGGLIYLYIKLREQRLKNLSLLQQERMMYEYEQLNNQVNPHFLFNSLNTLTSLIEDNKEMALDYTINLSDLYRNMLAYRSKDVILLKEECEILNNYIHIQKSRFGNALSVAINIPENLMNTKKIVPMALQLLVENALKHNIVSMAMPLHIDITADEYTITIRNTYQLKISKEKGTGIGLNNIRKRYDLLTNKPVFYGPNDTEFIVTLPLL
ncbi:MAG: histidine kinase [Taibaiella sp.]|nr:histidine kinase [Taibaiella sp.]